MKRKCLAIGIILLFVGLAVAPTINANIINKDSRSKDINYVGKPGMAFSNFINPCFKKGPGTIITNMSIILSASLTICDYDNDNDTDFIAGTVNNVYLLKKINQTFYEPYFIYRLPDNPDGFADDLYRGGLTSADYNNDGKEDFITGGVQGVVRLFINNCTNQSIAFNIKEIKDFPQTAWGLTSADFNKDGNMDFAASWADSPFTHATISIFYNNGNAEFTQHDIFTFSSNYIRGLDSGDYDNDGDIDIMFSHDLIKWHRRIPFNAIGEVSMLFNDGNNNFGNETIIIKRGLGFFFGGNIILGYWLPFRNLIGIDRICQKVTSADYDNDGDIELLVGDNSGKVEFYDNDGTGKFSTRGVVYDFGSFSWGLASADFDADGDIDVIVAASQRPDFIGHIYLEYNQIIE
ncbi:MAG TPA: hypothetical protein DSN98_08040 [Thermoplasmata archaeon]|nr:MAG TPA: hypothetical protein DSN98_08040 [Thermoplasmata archaeon]